MCITKEYNKSKVMFTDEHTNDINANHIDVLNN